LNSSSQTDTYFSAVLVNFLGKSPHWYKQTILIFLIVNPFVLLIPEYGFVIAGWLLVGEFIFVLAMSLSCYPLAPGGLLAIEAVFMTLTTPQMVFEELEKAFPVLLLLMFMVAAIYFMKDLLIFIFTKVLIFVRSKILLSLLFSSVAAVLSAFLDALTVAAVIISVAVGFYRVYEEFYELYKEVDEFKEGSTAEADHESDLDNFRRFLRSLLMHAAVGTALGGVMTMVGEPQNLLIAKVLGWEFMEFVIRMAPITMPVFVVGILTCLLLEVTKTFAYGATLPENVRVVLEEWGRDEAAQMTKQFKTKLLMQALAGVFLVVALGFHLAEVGIIGLAVIVLQTAMNGVTEEHDLGHAFREALPFTALLAVFFVIVAVIESQHLFQPVMDYVLSLPLDTQPSVFYIANGLLSAISDNVFVASIYISQAEDAFNAGVIDRDHLNLLGIAINTGTNIPSVLTPNGQAAFLFLLTSSVAPMIHLSYGRMVYMALPYFFTMGLTGWLAVKFLL